MAQLGGAEPAVELALLAGRPLGVLASLASFMPGGSVSCCRWWRLSGSARRGPDGFGSVVDGVRSGGPSLMELRPPEVLGSRRPPGASFPCGSEWTNDSSPLDRSAVPPGPDDAPPAAVEGGSVLSPSGGTARPVRRLPGFRERPAASMWPPSGPRFRRVRRFRHRVGRLALAPRVPRDGRRRSRPGLEAWLRDRAPDTWAAGAPRLVSLSPRGEPHAHRLAARAARCGPPVSGSWWPAVSGSRGRRRPSRTARPSPSLADRDQAPRRHSRSRPRPRERWQVARTVASPRRSWSRRWSPTGRRYPASVPPVGSPRRSESGRRLDGWPAASYSLACSTPPYVPAGG